MYEDFYLDFGFNLTKLMDERGLTYNQLAKDIGVSVHTVYNWKFNKSPRIKRKYLCQLAEYFGCTVDFLLGTTDSPDMARF